MKENELNIIYECRSGSHAYGTNVPESDEDYKGIAIGPKDVYVGCLNNFEQLEQKNPDRTVYDIRKFFRLAIDCNPNIIEVLYVDESDLLKITSSGELIRKNRDLFLSKKARFTHLGYAYAQLKRIRTHRNWLLNPIEKKPDRKDYGLPEEHKLISVDQQEAFIWFVANLINGSLEEAKLSPETLAELKELNFHGVLQSKIGRVSDEEWKYIQGLSGASDNFIQSMKQERAYSGALQEYNSYQNWKANRNPKRAKLEEKCHFDPKFAMHLIRLIKMGREILTGKGVIVKRPDAKELLAIRNGEWTYEQVEAYAENAEKEFAELYEKSTLQKEPARKELNELCQEIICKELFGS